LDLVASCAKFRLCELFGFTEKPIFNTTCARPEKILVHFSYFSFL